MLDYVTNPTKIFGEYVDNLKTKYLDAKIN